MRPGTNGKDAAIAMGQQVLCCLARCITIGHRDAVNTGILHWPVKGNDRNVRRYKGLDSTFTAISWSNNQAIDLATNQCFDFLSFKRLVSAGTGENHDMPMTSRNLLNSLHRGCN